MLAPLPDSVLLNQEPVRRSWWTLEITDSPIGPMPKDQGITIRSLPDLTARLCTVPTSLINSMVNVPGIREASSGCVSMHMHTNKTMLSWWWRWWEFIYNKGEIALYGDIVGQGRVRFYGPGANGSDPQAINTWKLVDIWPSSISIRALEQDNDGEPVPYEVELQIAEVTPQDL